MCSFTKKASACGGLRPPDPLPELRPGPRWGNSVPQTPSLPLCPPNNPVRSTPLSTSIPGLVSNEISVVRFLSGLDLHENSTENLKKKITGLGFGRLQSPLVRLGSSQCSTNPLAGFRGRFAAGKERRWNKRRQKRRKGERETCRLRVGRSQCLGRINVTDSPLNEFPSETRLSVA